MPWLKLLNTLSKEVVGLKHIEIGWGADCEFPWMLKRGAKERGLGDNVSFIRTLAKIQGLEKISLSGHYAKHWPSYLMAKTSAQVQAICGHYLQTELDDDPQTIQWIQELNESNLLKFKEYQKGTEDIVP